MIYWFDNYFLDICFLFDSVGFLFVCFCHLFFRVEYYCIFFHSMNLLIKYRFLIFTFLMLNQNILVIYHILYIVRHLKYFKFSPFLLAFAILYILVLHTLKPQKSFFFFFYRVTILGIYPLIYCYFPYLFFPTFTFFHLKSNFIYLKNCILSIFS